MKILKTCGLLLTLLVANGASANESTMKELNPTGKLRVALVFAPSMSIFFVVKENDKPRGVTADLAAALGKKLDVPIETVLFPNSGLAVDALEAGNVDVAFMPVDEERKRRIAFGPNYVLGESTYMVTAASNAKTVDEVDRTGRRVIGIAIAVGKNKPQALAAVTAFMNEAKKDGTVRKALDKAGFDEPVAPLTQ